MADRLFILRIKDADDLSEDVIKEILDGAAKYFNDLETGPEVVKYERYEGSGIDGRSYLKATYYIEETG